MAGKKDFAAVNTSNRVQSSIDKATAKPMQQAKATPQEAAQRKAEMRTQGRKGVKADRINMAFSSGNYQFIKVMARATGKTMTEFTNIVIAAYRREHPEFMEQAQGFIDFVNSGAFSSLDMDDTGSD